MAASGTPDWTGSTPSLALVKKDVEVEAPPRTGGGPISESCTADESGASGLAAGTDVDAASAHRDCQW